jgi:TNF receptor-associated protein 1
MEKHVFQAEIQQVLDIVIHSLYTEKEIFVRELVSNAADACEKLRFLQSSSTPIFESEKAAGIFIATDEKENSFTITDTGVGMTHDELVENLGSIAHSGSKAFLKQLAGGQKPDVNLIGQFGVGFYSAFMVAKRITVFARSFKPEEPGWKWTSEGAGGYEIEPAENLPRGVKIVVQLKEEEKDYARDGRAEEILRRYSNFVQFPIELNGKAVNTVKAIWARGKSEIKEEEYNEFYHYISHDHENPILRLHFAADAPLAIQALLFIPARNVESHGYARTEPEVNLYCRKVLIQPKAKGLLPEWLRFVRGVVDSEDLPLNVSRQNMQDNTLMQKLNKVLTGRLLKALEEQAEKDAPGYAKFYEQYARFIKEGVATDFTHRDALGKLLRFETSALPKGEVTSLTDYVKRMQPEQKGIYFLLARSRDAASTSPYGEALAAKKLEILFLYDPWDEFVMDHLHTFDGKPLEAAERAEVKLDDAVGGENALSEAEAEGLAKWVKETLGDRVGEVRASKRLVESPAVVLESDRMMTSSLRRVMRTMRKEGEAGPPEKQDLELNSRHPVIIGLERMRHGDTALAAKVTEQILDNAKVAAGLLEDPRSMLKRLNELLEQVLTKGGGGGRGKDEL